METDRRPESDRRMTFLEHLEELRARLLWSILSIAVALGMCWSWSAEILHFVMRPLKTALPNVTFITTGPTEAFSLHMKAAFFGGVFLAAPFVLYQIWAFISPGLHAHERRYAIPFVVLGSASFLAGGVFGHLVLFPATFRFLGQYAVGDIQYFPRLSEYFSFYFWFVVGLGLVFQLPLVILVLSRLGLVTPGFLIRKFKFAVLGAFVVSAIVTPSADVVNQTMLAAPILGLYLLGVLIAWVFGKDRRLDGDRFAVLAAAVTLGASWERRARRAAA
jgi:sec-independent protein translocase protein TatC